MKNKILKSLLLFTTACVVLCAVLLCWAFYHQLSTNAQDDLRERARMLRDTTVSDVYSLSLIDMRVTLVAADGKVLYDDDQDASLMNNHADREEIIEALATGQGKSRRYSDTLGQETYYYAVKLSDGSILRLGKTIDSIVSIFKSALPLFCLIVVLVLLAGYFVAGRLTRSIIAPINHIDPEDESTAPYDEFVPFMRTISHQREHIEDQLLTLKKRNDTISTIMDNTREGMILVDRQGVILSANKSALGIFDVDTDMSKRNILELFRDMELINCVREALNGQNSELYFDREGKVYQVFFSPVTDSGAIILFMDITEKARAEKMRQEFSANVSHELKTPLTNISGYAEMIVSGMTREGDIARFVGKIKEEAARLITLIEDIIMLSRLDEKADLPREDIELRAVAASVIDALQKKACENNIQLILDAAPVHYPCAPTLLYELLYNLVDNGIKYNRPMGNVTITLAESETQVGITVRDSGIGIPREDLERVFERFYRVDKSRSKKTGGTGLGLSIVKHIALLYGGTVEAQSEKNAGTCIQVTLPLGDTGKERRGLLAP